MTLIPTREIIFDRETHDYAMYLDGELVGFKPNHHEAEVELDRLVYEQLSRQVVYARPAEEVEPVAADPRPAQLPIENFQQAVGGKMWDGGYRSARLPEQARGFRFTVEVCEVHQILLAFPIYANNDGDFYAYALCDKCNRGRLVAAACPGNQHPCGRAGTHEVATWTGSDCETRRSVSLYYCDACWAERQQIYDDTLHIPARTLDGQCGDCSQTLGGDGRCERCIEEYIHDQGRYADMAADEPAPWERLTDQDAEEIAAYPSNSFCVSIPVPRAFDPALLLHWWHADREVCTLILMALSPEQLQATAAAFATYLNAGVVGSLIGAGLQTEAVLKVWSEMIDAASPPLLAA